MSTYWSRGNGWVFAALAKGAFRSPEIQSTLSRILQHLHYHGAGAGCAGSNLVATGTPTLGGTGYAGPESSGTLLFLYGLAWALNSGILDQNTYLPVVQSAWNFLANTAIQTSPPGLLGYVQPPDGAPGPATATTTEVQPRRAKACLGQRGQDDQVMGCGGGPTAAYVGFPAGSTPLPSAQTVAP